MTLPKLCTYWLPTVFSMCVTAQQWKLFCLNNLNYFYSMICLLVNNYYFMLLLLDYYLYYRYAVVDIERVNTQFRKIQF